MYFDLIEAISLVDIFSETRIFGLEKYISGVILFDETIRQKTVEGVPFADYLHNKGILSGIKVNLVKIFAFSFCGFAAGIAAAIQVSRISMGAPQAGLGMELQAIAAVILGGTSIYGGEGAVWRSVAGVMVLALINNGFNILNADPFWKDVTTGVIIFGAVALTAGRKR